MVAVAHPIPAVLLSLSDVIRIIYMYMYTLPCLARRTRFRYCTSQVTNSHISCSAARVHVKACCVWRRLLAPEAVLTTYTA